MKKFAFLFGNTNGLPGVQKDLQTVRNFLMSDIGGAWESSEISSLYENLSLSVLNNYLSLLKQANLDYLIVYFSGHGGSNNNKTYIYPSGNTPIVTNKLEHLAKRQINFYDCCRSVDENIKKSNNDFSTLDSHYNKNIREAFDNRIEQAAPQQMSLYSCDLGEYSIDEDGGVFTRNLIKAAQNISGHEKLMIDAYSEAKKTTQEDTGGKQNPKYKMAKLCPEQQLIISMNPNSIIINSNNHSR